MKSADDIERIIKANTFKAGGKMDDRIRHDVRQAAQGGPDVDSAWPGPHPRSTIMSNKKIRIAIAALVAIAIGLPLSYGAVKGIKKITQRFTWSRTVVTSNSDLTEQEIQDTVEQAKTLIDEGKAKEVSPGVYEVTLPDGKKIKMAHKTQRGSELSNVAAAHLDEITELRKSGDFERVEIDRWTEDDGTEVTLYQDRFTLADGTICTGETREETHKAKTEGGQRKVINIINSGSPADPDQE